MTTRCPYCDIEVSESAIEAEDGCCPECGSVITAPSQFMGDDDDLDELEDENYGDLDDEDNDDYIDEDALDEQLFDDAEEFDDFDEDFDEE